MLHSLWWHNQSADIRVHFLCGPQPNPRLRQRLTNMARGLGLDLDWVEVPGEMVQGLPRRDYISQVVWYRIFMPQLLPGLDRVLYLDADIIAMASIEPLWATLLGDDYFAAVTNIVPQQYRERACELGLPGPEHYFNAGIVLWNLDLMRRENFTNRVLEYSRKNMTKLLWLEQDTLNALFWNRRLPLHPRWNCQNGIFYNSWGIGLLDPQQMREALKAPALLHFEGGSFAKPWHYLSTHPLRERYFFHRRATPWPLRIPEGVTLKNIAKKHVTEPALWLMRRLRRMLA